MEEGDGDFPEDMLEALRWATAVLWITSGRVKDGTPPQIYKMIASPKGVSFTQIATIVPAFCDEMEQCIQRRRASALSQCEASSRAMPAPDDLF